MTRPDVLYLVHRVPYPPDKGDRIRTFHILEWLSRRAAVHLACLADEPVDEGAVAMLGRCCERVAIVPIGRTRWARALGSFARGRTVTEGAFHSPTLGATLRRWAGQVQFRAALASSSSMAPYLRVRELRDVPAVVDLIDVDSQKWLDYAATRRGPKAELYRLEGRRLRRLEHGLLGWTRAATLVSEAEAELFRRCHDGEGPVHAVTNGVDLEAFRPQGVATERGCVFVGALDYLPNVEGAAWFCREAWPEIRRRRPDATIALVGRRPTAEARRLAERPGVELVGQVPDVRPHLAVAAVAVVPLRIARGVQNKVLEAMAMGKAVVASPEALTGLRAEPGVHALVAEAPGEWADAVVQLLDDGPLRRRLGAAGRRHVEEYHRWDRCLDPFGALLGLPEEGGALAHRADRDESAPMLAPNRPGESG